MLLQNTWQNRQLAGATTQRSLASRVTRPAQSQSRRCCQLPRARKSGTEDKPETREKVRLLLLLLPSVPFTSLLSLANK